MLCRLFVFQIFILLCNTHTYTHVLSWFLSFFYVIVFIKFSLLVKREKNSLRITTAHSSFNRNRKHVKWRFVVHNNNFHFAGLLFLIPLLVVPSHQMCIYIYMSEGLECHKSNNKKKNERHQSWLWKFSCPFGERRKKRRNEPHHTIQKTSHCRVF